MTKATYNRKYLVGGWLAVSEHGFMTIRAGNTAAGRHSAGAVAEGLHLTHK